MRVDGETGQLMLGLAVCSQAFGFHSDCEGKACSMWGRTIHVHLREVPWIECKAGLKKWVAFLQVVY